MDKSHKPVYVVQINRPEARNAVDGETARLLHQAFVDFAEDDEVSRSGIGLREHTASAKRRICSSI